MVETKNIVVLISGTGSNMQALVRAAQQQHWQQRFGARIAGVLSNKAQAGGLAWAQAQGLPTALVEHSAYPNRAAFEAELMQAIARFDAHGRPALVLLAGFMRILGPDFVQHHAGHLLNIHPSLLPAFPGLHTHQRALEMGCRFVGATVHHVTAEVDCGQILEQAVLPVLPGDTPESLAARVLTQEHLIYPRAVERWLAGH